MTDTGIVEVRGLAITVLELFDREIFPNESTFYLDIQNGVSLLARLEFQGVNVGPERWERLAQASLASTTQCALWFAAMHVVAAHRLADLPRVRQLLNARLSTRIWDASSWEAFKHWSRLVDGIDDAMAVRHALRWALGEPDEIQVTRPAGAVQDPGH